MVTRMTSSIVVMPWLILRRPLCRKVIMPTLIAVHAKWRLEHVDVKASWS